MIPSFRKVLQWFWFNVMLLGKFYRLTTIKEIFNELHHFYLHMFSAGKYKLEAEPIGYSLVPFSLCCLAPKATRDSRLLLVHRTIFGLYHASLHHNWLHLWVRLVNQFNDHCKTKHRDTKGLNLTFITTSRRVKYSLYLNFPTFANTLSLFQRFIISPICLASLHPYVFIAVSNQDSRATFWNTDLSALLMLCILAEILFR